MSKHIPGKCEICQDKDSLVYLNGVVLVCWDCYKDETSFQARYQRGYGDDEFAYFDEYPDEDPFKEG